MLIDDNLNISSFRKYINFLLGQEIRRILNSKKEKMEKE